MMADTYPVCWAGRQAIVTMPDDIDVSNAGRLREQLLSVINRRPEALIADMNATVSCDHAGADVIVRVYQRALASGTDMRLVVSSSVVRRVLGAGGVDRLVPVYPSLEAALAARSPAPVACPAVGIGTEMALLDRDGVITSVNQAWRDFANANDGDPARTGPGASYLLACDRAGEDPVARAVAVAIRAALAGDLPGPLQLEVPCHSPTTERWFDVLISPRTSADGQVLGAAVTLSLARTRPVGGPAGGRAGLRLVPRAGPAADVVRPREGDALPAGSRSPAGSSVDVLADGIALTDCHGALMIVNRRLAEMFGYQDAELYGLPVEQLIPAHLQRAHRRHRSAYAEAPAVRPMGTGARLVGLRKDGSTFPAEVSLSPVQSVTGRLTLAVVRDATAGRTQLARAGPASAAATRAAEPAGPDLLDHITNRLFHLGLGLQAAADLASGITPDYLARALDIVDELIGEIRSAAFAGGESAMSETVRSEADATASAGRDDDA